MSAPGRRRAAAYQLVSIYATTLLNVINGLVLVPFYFRYFDLPTYGSWLATQNLVSWLSVLELGFNLIFAQRLVQHSTDPERFAETVGAGMSITVGSSLATLTVGSVAAASALWWMPSLIGASPENFSQLRLALVLAVAGTACTLLQAGLVAITASWLDTARPGLINVAALAVAIAMTFVGLASGLGVAALGLALLTRGVMAVLGLYVYVRRQYRRRGLPAPHFGLARARRLLRSVALPGVVRVVAMLAASSEATVAALVLGPTAAAVLGLSGRLYDVGRLLLVPISMAVFAPFADVAARDGAERTRSLLRELNSVVLALSIALFVPAVAINASFVRVWLGADAYAGDVVSSMLGLAVVLYTFWNLQSVLLSAIGRARESATVGVTDAVLRAAGFVVLPPLVGISGVPLAGIAGGLSATAIAYRDAARALATKVWRLLPGTELGVAFLGLVGAHACASLLRPASSWSELLSRAVPYGGAGVLLALVASAHARAHVAGAVRRLASRNVG